MNKQELIGNYKRISNFCETVSVNKVIQELEQLAESQKVTIPQFVADWINKAKGWGKTLYYALDHSPEEVNLWFCEDEANHQNIFARAWLDGYEIEKEKQYRVKVKGHIYENILVYGYGVKRYFFSSSLEGNRRAKHTRKELEQAGFGWVFDCPGIEVKEVEDE